MAEPGWITAQWPAPAVVRAGVTTRVGGFSATPYASFNLASHVGDNPDAVDENRAALRRRLQLPTEPIWLNQVHGVAVCSELQTGTTADACILRRAGQVGVVLTADCLPLLLCDCAGTVVAAVHAGWRGLASGVVAQTVTQMAVEPAQILVWLGPAIGSEAFEVGHDVRNAFLEQDEGYALAFRPYSVGKWLMDIYQAARLQLRQLGVSQVSGGGFCTYSDPERFFSYRRDGLTGRMASLIWISPNDKV